MKRRFSITWQEGELVILALEALKTDLAKDENFKGSAYWEYQGKAAERLQERLKEYNWEKPT